MGKKSTVGVLRLRATSAVSRGKSVRRSAQDDDFVGVLTKNIQDRLTLIGRQSWVNLDRTPMPTGDFLHTHRAPHNQPITCTPSLVMAHGANTVKENEHAEPERKARGHHRRHSSSKLTNSLLAKDFLNF